MIRNKCQNNFQFIDLATLCYAAGHSGLKNLLWNKLWPKVTVHTGAETIQGRKLFAEIRYAHLICRLWPICPYGNNSDARLKHIFLWKFRFVFAPTSIKSWQNKKSPLKNTIYLPVKDLASMGTSEGSKLVWKTTLII